MTFEWLGYLGVFFAAVYRIPQIIKLYRTKKGSDVSKKSFILHNGAYVSLILYLSLSKNKMDFILIGYYCIGLIQNGLIIAMKQYYKHPPLEPPSIELESEGV
jgi:uncharacterized protein with PQ loop repeat